MTPTPHPFDSLVAALHHIGDGLHAIAASQSGVAPARDNLNTALKPLVTCQQDFSDLKTATEIVRKAVGLDKAADPETPALVNTPASTPAPEPKVERRGRPRKDPLPVATNLAPEPEPTPAPAATPTPAPAPAEAPADTETKMTPEEVEAKVLDLWNKVDANADITEEEVLPVWTQMIDVVKKDPVISKKIILGFLAAPEPEGLGYSGNTKNLPPFKKAQVLVYAYRNIPELQY